MTKMADTIGSRLRAARESKGMSIEDAAFDTRIHAPYLRGLENDDYSSFASATYAKSFLSLYSRYLGVDADEALQFFEASNGIRLSGTAILPTLSSAVSTPAKPIAREGRTVQAKSNSPGFAPILLGFVVLALILGIPLLWYLGKDAESIDDVTSKAKAIAEATRQETTTGAVTAEPSAASADTVVPTEIAEAPAAPKTDAGTEESGTRSVAADWVLDASTPRKSASPAVASPEKPAAPATDQLAAVVSPAAPSSLQSLAPAPLRAVPSDPDSPVTPPTSPEASDTLSSPGTAPIDTPATTTDAPPVAMPLPLQASPGAPGTEPEKPTAEGPTVAAKPAETPKAGATKAAAKPETPAPAPTVLRATPLIAVPIEIPTEPGDGNATEPMPDEDPEEPPFVDPKNRFPRPVE